MTGASPYNGQLKRFEKKNANDSRSRQELNLELNQYGDPTSSIRLSKHTCVYYLLRKWFDSDEIIISLNINATAIHHQADECIK
jgi:hypothetical protein